MSRHASSAHVADGRGLSRGVSEVSQSPSCSSVIKPLFRASLMAASVAAAIGVATPAMAFEFSLADGEVKGSFDTTLSYGVLMRADKRDNTLVGLSSNFNGAQAGTAVSAAGDDGNRTYDRGDVISSLFKMTNELSLSYQNFGFFARTLAFYDTAVAGRPTSSLSGAGLFDKNLSPEAQKRLSDDARILDFYVRGSFDVVGKNLNTRIGRQVINWGESTFIPNGINIINPVDVARLRAPGSELKEGLLPQEMIWASQELTDTLSAEAFYQATWRETRIDPRGSFFSTTDAASPGGALIPISVGLYSRQADVEPGNSGQFGLALRKLLPEFNNTEVGAYYVNYHSRTPLVGTVKGSEAVYNGTGGVAGGYYLEYPRNIELFGLSLSSSGPLGTSVQAEYSYRPNMPIQISTIELLAAAFPDNDPAVANATVGALQNGFQLSRGNNSGYGDTTGNRPGTKYAGYREVKMHQVQSTITKSFGPQLGSSQLTTVAEVGLTYLDLPDGILFEGPGASILQSPSANPNRVNSNGYATKRSWGYRALARADYPNAIGAATLTPRIAFAHDVRGVGPTFNQGAQSINIGVTYNLRNTWQADLSYTGFFGGRTYTGISPFGNAAAGGVSSSSANPLKDRDFIAATVSYSF